MNTTCLSRAWVLLLPGALLADESYTGEGTVEVQMELASQHEVWGWHPAGEGRIAVDVQVDPAALTITHDAMTITVTNLTFGFTNDFTAGFGQVSHVETVLVFDPLICRATNLGTFGLTPGMDGVYQVGRYMGSGTAQLFPDLLVNGRYEIRGSTQTATGTFALPFAQRDFNARFPRFDLDTLGYPQQLVLLPDDYYSLVGFDNGLYGTDFSGTVDGVRIDMDLRNLRLVSRKVILSPKAPRLSLADRTSDGQTVLTAVGSPGQRLLLQASPDQKAWVTLSTNQCRGEPIQLVDADPLSYPQRFYRLVVQ